MSKKRARIKSAWWERGYLSHHYWTSKSKIGSVLLCHGPASERLYNWTCIYTNASGYASSLAHAKACVESAYKMGWVQVPLDGVPVIEDVLQHIKPSERPRRAIRVSALKPATSLCSHEGLLTTGKMTQADLFG